MKCRIFLFGKKNKVVEIHDLFFFPIFHSIWKKKKKIKKCILMAVVSSNLKLI